MEEGQPQRDRPESHAGTGHPPRALQGQLEEGGRQDQTITLAPQPDEACRQEAT